MKSEAKQGALLLDTSLPDQVKISNPIAQGWSILSLVSAIGHASSKVTNNQAQKNPHFLKVLSKGPILVAVTRQQSAVEKPWEKMRMELQWQFTPFYA